MRSKLTAIVPMALAPFVLGLAVAPAIAAAPFGGDEDVAFAADVWKAMQDYETWRMKSGVYPGTSPHGAFLRLYYNLVDVDGKPYHVIVKDNFGGEGAKLEKVAAMPGDYLAAVTVMVQMPEGYDPENGDWFYAKYDPDGEVSVNDQSMAMAGRVGDGTTASCLGCHLKAGDGDYIFTND